MIFLILSIIASSVTVSFFKLFEKAGVNTFQAIIFNYATCAIIGNLLAGKDAVILTPFWQQAWFPYTILIGIFFISIFFTIGITAQKMGVSVSMVAAKMSVVIPVLTAIIWQHETLNIFQIIGIVISLLSVYFISKKENSAQQNRKWLFLLPLIVFIGSGVIDTAFNTMTKNFNATNSNALFGAHTVTTAYSIALMIGVIIFAVKLSQGTLQFEKKNLLWGIALGIPNYFSMYFLVETLSYFSQNSAVILPVNNIGIVAASTLVSVYLFKEKLNRQNIAGLVFSAVAIVLLSL